MGETTVLLVTTLESGGRRETVQELINNGSLVQLEYQGRKFYARKLPARSSAGERRKAP